MKINQLSLTILFLSITIGLFGKNDKNHNKSPNVLFIIVDDLNMLVGSYGAEGVITPSMDKLADEGRRFNRAYVQNAACNPSRASFMTGRRPHQLKIQGLQQNFRDLYPDIVTIPQHFKEHGYHSVGIGKIYHNWGRQFEDGDPKSWSESPKYHWAAHFHDWYVPGRPYQLHYDLEKGPAVQMEDVPDEAYLDGRIANAAVNKLRELQETPFFLAVGFWKPHLPFNAPKKYWDLYDRDNLPSPPLYDEPVSGVPDVAYIDSPEARSYTDVPNEGEISKEQKKELRHGYLATISYLDAQVGKILDELERLKMDKNTIVVFFSDHGFHAGEHGQFGKWTNFEIGTQIPFIIRTPNIIKPGVKSNNIVEMIDLYPTLIELSDIPWPDDQAKLAGVSLVPILDNPETEVKNAAISQTIRPIGSGIDIDILGSSIRTKEFRYNIWVNQEDGNIMAKELYNLTDNQYEVRNLIYDSNFESIRDQLHNKLLEILAQ